MSDTPEEDFQDDLDNFLSDGNQDAAKPVETPSSRAEFNGFASAIREMITYMGDDPDRDGLQDTPNRVMKSWDELYAGYQMDLDLLFTTFDPEDYKGPVVLAGIEFYSMCEHHMLPFFGTANVAYIPNGKIVGISKLARLVEVFSRRLQNQERLVSQIQDALCKHLEPLGTAILIEGSHMCMKCRGVRKQSTSMITQSYSGLYETSVLRSEFFSTIAPYRKG